MKQPMETFLLRCRQRGRLRDLRADRLKGQRSNTNRFCLMVDDILKERGISAHFTDKLSGRGGAPLRGLVKNVLCEFSRRNFKVEDFGKFLSDGWVRLPLVIRPMSFLMFSDSYENMGPLEQFFSYSELIANLTVDEEFLLAEYYKAFSGEAKKYGIKGMMRVAGEIRDNLSKFPPLLVRVFIWNSEDKPFWDVLCGKALERDRHGGTVVDMLRLASTGHKIREIGPNVAFCFKDGELKQELAEWLNNKKGGE